METLMRKMQENRKNNKGFTLVELIIVIAIVAVLAAVLAPQYLKYVEKSRVAADKDVAAAIEQAVNVLCADGSIKTAVTAANDITWTTSTGGLSGTNAGLVTAITGTIPAAQSTKGKAANIVYTVAFAADGTPSVTPSVPYKGW